MIDTGAVQTVPELRAAADQLKVSGRPTEAVDLYRQCLLYEPADPDLLYDLGETLLELGNLDEAADRFRQALAQAPQDAAGTIMLARVLHRLKKPVEAYHFYRRAQQLAPHLPVVHLMAGITALESNRRDVARQAFERALELDPDQTSARLCRCMALLDMFDSQEELEARRADFADALTDLVRHTPLDSKKAIDRAVEAVGLQTTFLLPYQGKNDRDLQRVYGAWLCRVMAAHLPQFADPEAMPAPASGEKLRIGFVCAHFSHHSVWKIITRGWLTHLDRSRFLLFCYYTGDICDAATEEARRLADCFVRGTDGVAMAETISHHQPHLLIYPGLGMDPHTIRLAALRLAPVQCVAWGHPNTTGLPTMDYFLSSDLMEPPDGDQHYTESLVRLPNLSVCYEPLLLPTELPPTQIPGVEPGDVSFLCCQNLMKYLPQHDDVFPAIAARVPRAKFIFITFAESHRRCFVQRLEQAFARYGLSADAHLVFLPKRNAVTYAVLNAEIDIYLDSIGWSGGNTTFESLPFNKPIVTLPGEFMRGRHTTAILRMMGLDELIAADQQQYVEIAVRLAHDSAWRAAVSARIAANKHRVYGDLTSVRALEEFMEQAVASSQRCRR